MGGGTDEAAAIGAIHAAVDCGVTLIDTAPAYGFGRSEEILGQTPAQGGRRKRFLTTKVGIAGRSALAGAVIGSRTNPRSRDQVIAGRILPFPRECPRR
jgi:aryl-alcohol dehydrogenase-like predicted oxidoreductase